MSSESESLIAYDLVVIDVSEAVQEIADNWGWILAEGILNVIFGLAALLAPVLATAYVGLYVNSALVVSGIINISGLFFAERGLKMRSALMGIVQVYMGALLEYYPLEGLVAVTIIIAVMFMIDGVYRIILADQNRDLPGWFWTLMGGLVSVAAGVLVLATLPASSLDTIGTLVGMHLLSVGPTRIKIAFLGHDIAIMEKGK